MDLQFFASGIDDSAGVPITVGILGFRAFTDAGISQRIRLGEHHVSFESHRMREGRMLFFCSIHVRFDVGGELREVTLPS
jgi:hypothetical protein